MNLGWNFGWNPCICDPLPPSNILSFIDESLIFLLNSHVIPHYLTSSSYHHQSSAESYKMEAAVEESSSSTTEVSV